MVWQLAVSLMFINVENFTVLFILSQMVGNIVPVLFAASVARRSGFQLIAWKKPDRTLVFNAVILGFLIQPFGSLVSFITHSFGFDERAVESIAELINTNTGMSGLILIAVLPAITEELVSRGAFLSGYRDVAPVKAAVMSGLIFGLMHMNFRQFFYAFTLGALISIVVIYSGNIIYAIIMHFVVNTTQFTLVQGTALLLDESSLAAEAANAAQLTGVEFFIGGVMLLGFAGVTMWFCFKVLQKFEARCILLELGRAGAPREGKIHLPTLAVVVVLGILFMLL